MSFENYQGDPEDNAAKLAFFFTLFNQQRTRRVNFEQQWEEGAALAWPEYMSSFFYGRDIAPGAKRTQFQIDSSVSVASHRFGAIVDWLVTPSNLMWSKIEAGGPHGRELMRDRTAKQWFKNLTHILWQQRYRAEANFIAQNQQNMQGLGVFGNMGMFVDELADYLDPRDRGIRYLGLPVGEIYLLTDHQRRVVGFTRHFRLTAQQFKTRWPMRKVPVIEAALMISSQQLFDILHFVRPRTDYHPDFLLTNRGKKFESTYISVQGYCILEEDGYRVLPLAYGRYMLAPDEDYGRGPMQMVLASAKTKNSQKRVFLKQGHLAGDPAYLVADTGLVDLKTHSGAWNSGGMSPDGKPLVGILPTGQIQITKEMMAEEDGIIKDAFLVSLFQMVLGDKQNEMSPRQVLEYINERGILLYPTVGGQSGGYCGPLIDRELDILSWLRFLPPMPPVLREAKADYQIVYTNPITRAMQAQGDAGFVRSVEFIGQAIQAGADPALMDILALDRAIPMMGEHDNAPMEYYSTPQEYAQKTKGRQQAQERETQTKELPGRAAIIKAQAIQSKAATGGNIGGALSGVPQGQQPMMPGQNQPGGSPFGTQGGGPDAVKILHDERGREFDPQASAHSLPRDASRRDRRLGGNMPRRGYGVCGYRPGDLPQPWPEFRLAAYQQVPDARHHGD